MLSPHISLLHAALPQNNVTEDLRQITLGMSSDKNFAVSVTASALFIILLEGSEQIVFILPSTAGIIIPYEKLLCNVVG